MKERAVLDEGTKRKRRHVIVCCDLRARDSGGAAVSDDIRAEAERLGHFGCYARGPCDNCAARSVEIEAALRRQRGIGCGPDQHAAIAAGEYQRGREDGAREEREHARKRVIGIVQEIARGEKP